MSKTYEIPPAPPLNHGKTIAAWVMTYGVVGGAVVVAIGMVMAQMPIMAAGAVVMLATVAISIGLRAAGLGQKKKPGRSRE